MKKPIIEFKDVSKVFEDNGTTVLKNINFELEEGNFIPFWVHQVLANPPF